MKTPKEDPYGLDFILGLSPNGEIKLMIDNYEPGQINKMAEVLGLSPDEVLSEIEQQLRDQNHETLKEVSRRLKAGEDVGPTHIKLTIDTQELIARRQRLLDLKKAGLGKLINDC